MLVTAETGFGAARWSVAQWNNVPSAPAFQREAKVTELFEVTPLPLARQAVFPRRKAIG